jgi:hypothetical protein
MICADASILQDSSVKEETLTVKVRIPESISVQQPFSADFESLDVMRIIPPNASVST